MGNCQAVDVAASVLVIQHPNGRIERMYSPISVGEVMKMNPGHYVSLIIPLPPAAESTASDTAADETVSPSVSQRPAPSGVDKKEGKYKNKPTIQFTRVKLLRPSDTLVLGRAYRLVTSQEVVKVLREKKNAKMNKNLTDVQDRDSPLNSNGILTASSSSSSSPSSERETSTSHDAHKGTPRLESQNRSRKSDSLQKQRSSTAEEENNKSAAALRSSKSWRPSLQSISEATR